ncbi:hypothetical protein D0809_05950 [Flavobacterium circumlabens]|uniref:DUF3955 domain-containing protein n=1 Tax=Flavobacterium circumlabens TaxID=2133765 RepID=A0A4Y7UEV4_9FLAO|nr:hypothetical protein D0809_05950 [Flavobacterium circumlabens]
MKYFIYFFFILGIGMLIYGYIYPSEYCLDINIHDTYYVFTYLPVATIVLLFSLILYIVFLIYKKIK